MWQKIFSEIISQVLITKEIEWVYKIAKIISITNLNLHFKIPDAIQHDKLDMKDLKGQESAENDSVWLNYEEVQ